MHFAPGRRRSNAHHDGPHSSAPIQSFESKIRTAELSVSESRIFATSAGISGVQARISQRDKHCSSGHGNPRRASWRACRRCVREISVRRKPRVAILSSGDELVELRYYSPSDSTAKIISANSWTLRELIVSAGGEPVDLGIAADTPAFLRAKLELTQIEHLISSSPRPRSWATSTTCGLYLPRWRQLDFWKSACARAPMAFGTLHGIPWLGFSEILCP